MKKNEHNLNYFAKDILEQPVLAINLEREQEVIQ